MNFSGINFSIHKDGYRFIGIGAGATIVFSLFSTQLALFCLILTLFCMLFFRNPKRAIPSDPALIVSPADGAVCSIALEVPPPELNISGEKRYRVSIFLSIFDVHINRLPVSGKVLNIIYSPGSFLNASLEKSSIFNEKNTIVIEMDNENKDKIAFSQIAGMIARRIVCDIHEGQEVSKGEIFGLIRFGSRCDIWLPPNCSPQVIVGQTMVSGETVIADLSAVNSSPRDGRIL